MSDVPATATATATKSPIPDIGEFFLIPAHASQLALGRCDRCGAAFKGQEVLFLYRLVQGQSFGSPVKAHVPNCLRPWELTWLLEQPQLLQETQYLNWRMPSLLNPANPPYFWPRENDKPTAQTLRILRALIGYFQKCVTERQVSIGNMLQDFNTIESDSKSARSCRFTKKATFSREYRFSYKLNIACATDRADGPGSKRLICPSSFTQQT